MDQHHVPAAEAMPMLRRLITRCGGLRPAAEVFSERHPHRAFTYVYRLFSELQSGRVDVVRHELLDELWVLEG